MNTNLFVYGTLQIPEILERVIGRRIAGEVAILQGYRRGKVSRANFPGIVPDNQSEVQGLVLGGITPPEIELLDFYEGELYQRTLVKIKLGEGKQTQAWVYAMGRWALHRVCSQDWSIQEYIRTKKYKRLTCRS